MLEIKELVVEIENFRLQGVDLQVKESEYFVVLGPNGAGKTVLLETIAGLNRQKKGSIHLKGRDLTSLLPEERKIGYVPQDCVLFPFLNVEENIEFGLKTRSYPSEQRKKRIEFLAEKLAISHLLKRDVKTLSGGERQKVAIARALAPYPEVLLLDEPLANVDLSTSKLLRLELKRFHKEFGITTIHVTHNLFEAEELADRMAIISSGKIEQVGTPDEIMFFPKNEIVSKFLGNMNILDVETVKPLGHGLFEAKCGDLKLVIPHDGDSIKKIALSSRDIYVSRERPPGPEVNRFRGTILEVEEDSAFARMKTKVGENILWVELPMDTFLELALKPKNEIYLIFKLRRLKIYGG